MSLIYSNDLSVNDNDAEVEESYDVQPVESLSSKIRRNCRVIVLFTILITGFVSVLVGSVITISTAIYFVNVCKTLDSKIQKTLVYSFSPEIITNIDVDTNGDILITTHDAATSPNITITMLNYALTHAKMNLKINSAQLESFGTLLKVHASEPYGISAGLQGIWGGNLCSGTNIVVSIPRTHKRIDGIHATGRMISNLRVETAHDTLAIWNMTTIVQAGEIVIMNTTVGSGYVNCLYQGSIVISHIQLHGQLTIDANTAAVTNIFHVKQAASVPTTVVATAPNALEKSEASNTVIHTRSESRVSIQKSQTGTSCAINLNTQYQAYIARVETCNTTVITNYKEVGLEILADHFETDLDSRLEFDLKSGDLGNKPVTIVNSAHLSKYVHLRIDKFNRKIGSVYAEEMVNYKKLATMKVLGDLSAVTLYIK